MCLAAKHWLWFPVLFCRFNLLVRWRFTFCFFSLPAPHTEAPRIQHLNWASVMSVSPRVVLSVGVVSWAGWWWARAPRCLPPVRGPQSRKETDGLLLPLVVFNPYLPLEWEPLERREVPGRGCAAPGPRTRQPAVPETQARCAPPCSERRPQPSSLFYVLSC